MVLELTGPADWDVLSAVWRGVQADLELPAPAIAVSGTDGLQLWFSLEAPVPAAQLSRCAETSTSCCFNAGSRPSRSANTLNPSARSLVTLTSTFI